MIYNPSYNIAVDREMVVVRFKRDLLDQALLAKFLDYVEWQSIRQRSQLSESQAAELADEIDRAVWNTLKNAFGN